MRASPVGQNLSACVGAERWNGAELMYGNRDATIRTDGEAAEVVMVVR
jgi:hypothetical protein